MGRLIFCAFFFFSGQVEMAMAVDVSFQACRDGQVYQGSDLLFWERRSTFCLALLAKHQREHQRQHFRNNCAWWCIIFESFVGAVGNHSTTSLIPERELNNSLKKMQWGATRSLIADGGSLDFVVWFWLSVCNPRWHCASTSWNPQSPASTKY